jgi:glycosyltransferase involved in cell wall biosynthesis
MNLGPPASAGRSPAARPCVSVIIPTRDRPAMLHEAIASVRAQSFTDYEIIVVVNGPDNPHTAQTLEVSAAAGCEVERIDAAGIAVALNAGIAAARGEWLAFLDDDDHWEPSRLEVGLATADATKADVIFCNFVMFDERGGTPAASPGAQPPLSAKETMTIKNCGAGCSSTMVRRSAAQAIGGFDPALVSPDWDFWMRLSWRYPVAWVDAHLVWVRMHPENTSKRISWAYWTLRIQYKALKTLPPELRHLRGRLLREMLKVAAKGAESYLRLSLWRRFKRRKPARAGPLAPPAPTRTPLPLGEKSPISQSKARSAS